MHSRTRCLRERDVAQQLAGRLAIKSRLHLGKGGLIMAYIYTKAAELKGKPVVGTRQCVALVQEFAGAPVTSRWRQGEAVVGNAQLRAGTANSFIRAITRMRSL
jgi:hypothetical protein